MTALEMAQLGADRYKVAVTNATFKAVFWRFLNTAGREIFGSANWWWTHEEVSVTFVEDAKDITLTGLVGIDHLINKIGNRMQRIPERLYQAHFRNSTEASGEPVIWAIVGRNSSQVPLLSIWPAPDNTNAGTATVGKLLEYTDLTSDSHVSKVPVQFHEVQVNWALALQAATDKDDAVGMYEGLRKAGLDSMLQENAAHTAGLGP